MDKLCGCANGMTAGEAHERAFHLARKMIEDEECPTAIVAVASALMGLGGDLLLRAIGKPDYTNMLEVLAYGIERAAVEAAISGTIDEVGDIRKDLKQYRKNLLALEAIYEAQLAAKEKLDGKDR